MKKIICIILSVVMMMISLVPALAAAPANETEKVNISQNSSNFYCNFNSEKNIIEIGGTINHDVLVKYGNYDICIYKIPFNTDYEAAIKNMDNRVVSHAPISIKFEYAIPVSAIQDRFAKYALVLSSPNGDTYLASDMKIPAVYGEYEYVDNDKSGFKGIEIDNIARASNLLPGTAIVNVYLDSLYGNASNCYLYPMGDTFAYIDKSVISELDSQIMTLSQTQTHIYLRFLVLSEGNINSVAQYATQAEAPYTIPDIYNEQTLDFICAASSFIAERYNGGQRGYINGVVLGKAVDNVETVNHIHSPAFEEYIEKYVVYMLAVANSMKSINPNIRMVVPISDANDYSQKTEHSAKTAEFIEGLLYNLETYFSDESMFSLMLEINDAPFGISNDNLGNIIDTSRNDTVRSTVNIENITEFASYFEKLSERFDNAPESYSVLWNVPHELSGNALSCAYAYSYYKLFTLDKLEEFIISFDEASATRFDELSNIFRYIDTANTFEATENILKYFGVTSWSKILNVKSASAYASNIYYELERLDTLPEDIKGEFDYFEFSSSTGVHNWKNGINTKNIKTEYHESGERALHISSRELEIGDSFEAYYLYESPENLAYTQYLSLDFNIDALDVNAVFEISVMLGNGNTLAYASRALAAGNSGRIILDIGEFSEENKAQYLKISVRALTDGSESVSVWLGSVKGYSTEYDDAGLARVIELERSRVQDDSNESYERGFGATALTVIIVTVVIIIIGVGMFILFKKEDDS